MLPVLVEQKVIMMDAVAVMVSLWSLIFHFQNLGLTFAILLQPVLLR